MAERSTSTSIMEASMQRIGMVAALAVVLTGGAKVAAAADLDGEVLFNTHCRNCHSIKEGDNRLGPALHGIVGKEAGTVAGFAAYSGSLKGFTWDVATLDKFIAAPASVAPNTSMIYPPVDDPAVRKAIIDFMQSKSK